MIDSSKSIGNMIENIVRSDLTNEMQTVSEQQNKQFAEKKEQRMKGLRDEVKNAFSMAVRLDNEVEQELNNLGPIADAQSEHGHACAEILRNIANSNNQYSEWMAAHEQRFKNVERTAEDMGDMIVEDEQPDEKHKIIKNLLSSAESKYLLLEGKRETIALVDADLDVIRADLQELEQSSELCES